MSDHVDWDSLNDLADGALSPGARMVVEAHVSGCSDCQTQLTKLRELARNASDAPESIEPPDGAWPGVRDRLAGDRRSLTIGVRDSSASVVGHLSAIPVRGGARRYTVSTPWLVAAALVLVAGSSAVTALVIRRGPSANSTIAATTVISNVSLPADIRASEQEFLETAEALRGALDEERGRLTPQTVAIVERSLTVIEGAIGEAREALVRDPANRELRALWSRNHQQKLDLLRRAAALVQKT